MRQNIGVSAVGFQDLSTLLKVADHVANQVAAWGEEHRFKLHLWSVEPRSLREVLPSIHVLVEANRCSPCKVEWEHSCPDGVKVQDWIECVKLILSAILARDWVSFSFDPPNEGESAEAEEARSEGLTHFGKKNWRGCSFTRRGL